MRIFVYLFASFQLLTGAIFTQNVEFNDRYILSVDEKSALLHRTISDLNHEISKIPTSKEERRLIAIAKRLVADLSKLAPYLETTPLPGCCLYEGSHYLANVVAIAEKQERVQEAIRYLEQSNSDNQTAREFFYKCLEKLQSGYNVPLPDYFHATREGLESIIASKTLLQSKTGFTGPGVYLSCNNEGNYGYGSHTFALDEGCLVNSGGKFRTGRRPGFNDLFFSMWVSVLQDLPISEENIAFIDTSLDDIPYVEALLAEQNIAISVVDRKTAQLILNIFDKTTKRRELASFFWVKYDPTDYLPQNMYCRSEEGNFRRFFGV